MTKVGPFVAIMRRVIHCGFSSVVLNNRMFLQCYDLAIDSDVGLHYVLPVPDKEDYSDPLYDKAFVIAPRKFLDKYNAWHKEMENVRKEKGVKIKDVCEELCFKESGVLKVLYHMGETLIGTMTFQVEYPIDSRSSMIENIEQTYQSLLERIKPGGVCLMYDGLRLDLQNRAADCSEIYYFIAKYGKKRIRVPIYKSLFNGIKEVDRLIITLQESNVGQDVYIYCVHYMKKGIAENMWGYILAF